MEQNIKNIINNKLIALFSEKGNLRLGNLKLFKLLKKFLFLLLLLLLYLPQGDCMI